MDDGRIVLWYAWFTNCSLRNELLDYIMTRYRSGIFSTTAAFGIICCLSREALAFFVAGGGLRNGGTNQCLKVDLEREKICWQGRCDLCRYLREDRKSVV